MLRFAVLAISVSICSPVVSQTCQVQFEISCSELEPGATTTGCAARGCRIIDKIVQCPVGNLERLIPDTSVKVIRSADPGEEGYVFYAPTNPVLCTFSETCGDCDNYHPVTNPNCGLEGVEEGSWYMDLEPVEDPLIQIACVVALDP